MSWYNKYMILKKQRPKIGLALGCGGARGFAHIGVIKMLKKHNIPIDMIAGSSAGSFIGGLYASKQDINAVEKSVMNITSSTVLSFLFDPCFNQGIANGTKFKNFFKGFIGDKQFNQLPIPFAAVATDIKTGSHVVLNEGDVTDAVHASSAIPFLFKPITYKNHILADGGLSMPVPVQIVKDMGADIVIAVNLSQEYFVEGYIETLGMSHMFLNSLNILSHHLANEHIKTADITISPPLKHVRWKLGLAPSETQEIITIGENIMAKEIPRIKQLIEERSIPLWKTYVHSIHTIPKLAYNSTQQTVQKIKILQKEVSSAFSKQLLNKNPNNK